MGSGKGLCRIKNATTSAPIVKGTMKSISRATRSSTRVPGPICKCTQCRRPGGVGVQSSQFIRGTAPGERERTFGDFYGKHHALGRSRARGDESSAESPAKPSLTVRGTAGTTEVWTGLFLR